MLKPHYARKKTVLGEECEGSLCISKLLTCHKTQEVEDSLPGGQPQVAQDAIRVAELGVARLDPLALLGADVEDGLGLQQQEGLHAPLLNQHAVGLHIRLVPHADVPTHGHGDNTVTTL